MNLKYYLRGLGIGIAMTTIIIGLGVERPVEKLTDEQIKARAAELGMVEAGGRLSDLVSETPSPEAKKENTEEAKETTKPTQMPKVEAKEEVKETEKSTETPKPDETPKTEETKETAKPTETPKAETEEAKETAKPTETPKAETAKNEEKAKETPKPTATPKPTKTPETPEKSEQAEPGSKVTITVKSGEGSYTVCKKLEEAGLIASATAYDAYLGQNGYDKKLQVGVFEIPNDAEPEEIALILMKR